MVRAFASVLGLLVTLPAPAPAQTQTQSQFYYCAGGLDPARNLYVSQLFVADHSEATAIGAAFREFVEAHYGYSIPFPSRNPCKEFRIVEQAGEALQKEIDDSRALDSNVVETGWVYHRPSRSD
jgi:hypothetical protein